MISSINFKKSLTFFVLSFLAFVMIFSSRIMDTYAAETVDVSWGSVSIDKSGTISWSYTTDSVYEVSKYYIQIARQSGGSWNESYKTLSTADDSYDYSFSSTGNYRAKVRIYFVGGIYSEWSDWSEIVSIGSDDTSGGTSSSWDPSRVGLKVIPTATGSSCSGPGSTVTYSYGPGGTYNYSYGPGASASVTAAGSGWQKTSSGWMYIYANGTYLKSGWDLIDDYWYYFDNYGIMQTGWLYDNGHWYYLFPSGKMATSSWNNINEKWYYFNESGIMQTGYITIGDKTYYADNSGARVDSGYNPDGHLFDINGVMIS